MYVASSAFCVFRHSVGPVHAAAPPRGMQGNVAQGKIYFISHLNVIPAKQARMMVRNMLLAAQDFDVWDFMIY